MSEETCDLRSGLNSIIYKLRICDRLMNTAAGRALSFVDAPEGDAYWLLYNDAMAEWRLIRDQLTPENSTFDRFVENLYLRGLLP